MKKTYIAPALKAHQIGIESDILVASPYGRAIFGNRKMMNQSTEKYEYVTPYEEDEGYTIDPIEGDEWSTL